MNLIIDGNSLLNVVTNAVLYSIRGNSNFDTSYIVVDSKQILKDGSKSFFKSFILKYITSVVTPLNRYLNHVYFVFDLQSWRKFYIEKYFDRHADIPGFVYKGHRKVDDHRRELMMFFEYFRNEMMTELLAIDGVHSISVKGSEGDDIIAVLCENINDDKAIWTCDSDMSQLVRAGSNFTMIMGPRGKNKMRKLILPQGYDGISALANLDAGSFNIDGLIRYLSSEREYEKHVVEPNHFILGKIITGDQKSDNIPSMYVRISKDHRRMGITESKAEKILCIIEAYYVSETWISRIDEGDEEFASRVVDVTMEVASVPKEERTRVLDNYWLNRKIIRLSTKVIPEEMTRMIMYKHSLLDLSKKFDYDQYLNYAQTED